MYQYPKCSTITKKLLLHTLLLVVLLTLYKIVWQKNIPWQQLEVFKTHCNCYCLRNFNGNATSFVLCNKALLKRIHGKVVGIMEKTILSWKISRYNNIFVPMYAKRWSLKHHFQAVGLDGIKLVLQVCQLLLLPLLFDVHDDLCGKGWCK